ncbi:MAG: hypothetical protein GWN00_09435, partial [Aliifodinibius sp.]|nr:hypothetical protein [Fodinibius sp.]NIV11392.1 hypothetical protein [Fodinibius sp.]NIY25013.1 hypothetical protein [Fodinibius sp.]
MWFELDSGVTFSHSTLVSSDSNIETIDIVYSESNAYPLFFMNSIVWGRCWPEASEIFATFGRNIGEPMNTCGFGESDIILESDPLLLPLGDYGGPTPTAPPALGSPAIDNGGYLGGTTFSNPPIDQRGIARPQSWSGGSIPKYDIGSVERESFTNIFKELIKDLRY